jgi:hypothetical protein
VSGAPTEEPLLHYRASGREARTLTLQASHTRGSLTLGTFACILIALASAWYPTINRGKFQVECRRESAESRMLQCTLARDAFGITVTEQVRINAYWAHATVESERYSPPANAYASRVVVRGAGGFTMGRYPATEAEASAVADELNAYFQYPKRAPAVTVSYGPAPTNWWEVGPWLALAFGLFVSLLVRRQHRVVLRWDPAQKYLIVERRRWPLRTAVQHVAGDLLIGARVEGGDVVETHLRFASGRTVSLFGKTVANRTVHENAVKEIDRFLVEQGSP